MSRYHPTSQELVRAANELEHVLAYAIRRLDERNYLPTINQRCPDPAAHRAFGYKPEGVPHESRTTRR